VPSNVEFISLIEMRGMLKLRHIGCHGGDILEASQFTFQADLFVPRNGSPR
jgi:hypothetical protein